MVHMSTFETLDCDSIEDEYDMDRMEELEQMEEEELEQMSADVEPFIPQPAFSRPPQSYMDAWQNNPAFSDVSVWESQGIDMMDFHGIPHDRENDLYKGRLWGSKEDARSTVEKYSVEKGVEFKTRRSNLASLKYVCKKGENCPWEVKILKKAKSTYWELVKFKGNHTCRTSVIPSDIIHLNKKMIAEKYCGKLCAKLRLEPKRIQADVLQDFGYQISYLKAWQAKQLAMDMVFGTWEESFTKLPRYMDVLQATNEGTFVKWDIEDMGGWNQINRVFWSFGPAIQAFQHCRPVLSVDGTHLYGKYNGRLLIAIGLDAQNQLLPLAFALVESENNASWRWFMQCIREGVTQRNGLCVISDRHKGILSVMNTIDEWRPPRAYHRYCLRHVKSNFNDKAKSEPVLKDELGRIGYIADEIAFEKSYGRFLNELDRFPDVKTWMMGIPVKKWALAFDEGRRWGAMTTNNAECFNNVLKGCRDLPVCAIVNFTFMQCNKYFNNRRDALSIGYSSPFVPRIDNEIQELVEQGSYFQCIMFDRSNMIVQVLVNGIDNHYLVNMSERTCTCGRYTAYHYPCSHALRVIRDNNLDLREYIPREFTVQAYSLTWAPTFNYVPPESCWPPHEFRLHYANPRYKRALKGKTPSTRRRNEMDWGDSQRSQSQRSQTEIGGGSGETSGSRTKQKHHCRICGSEGHNSRSCPIRNSN